MRVLWILLASVATATCMKDFDWDTVTALDEYVHRDDGAFSWELIEQYRYTGVDLYILNMTSQIWMDETYSNHPIWWHTLIVAIPDDLRYPDAGILAITGGGNRLPQTPPPIDDWGNVAAAMFANDTGTVVGYIKQIPNQPIVFVNDETQRERSEDSQIAWTWREYMDGIFNGTNPNPEGIARFPMTKACKRALDAMEELTEEMTGNNLHRFAVGGASKRGWTTWSLAAVDRRVIAIVPMVMSLLNFEQTLMHHFQTMDGGWSFAFRPYYDEGLTEFLTDEIAEELFQYEDMYYYRSRLDMPKLVISATGDEFFLCSDSHYWWQDMPGKMWFMMCPNSEHTLFPHYLAILRNLGAFWLSILQDIEIPEVSWQRTYGDNNGKISYKTNVMPENIVGFESVTLSNITRRDWRLFAGYPDPSFQPAVWRRQNVTFVGEEDGEYEYELEIDEVEDEWVGFFVQADFEGPERYDFKLTSEVHIIPDTFPRGPCEDDECVGELV